ncbi:hypothetical protein Nepgr_003754 [Nepenthes gracilis]|uniref:Core-2/I-branching beta-1,6-N-acetylglucosaminyltransferase family protein n=1 Tax=Nepenthes gracilis TaxID=150966 RepID=A0AAD3S045_NEPGR|nr:hypothetical protein Nepgr_003754 [Nepenthes gracilis]
MARHCKIAFVRELSSWIQKNARENSPQTATFHVTITIIFCFTVAFFVIVLAMFVNHRISKMMVLEEYYYPNQLVSPCSPCNAGRLFSDISVPSIGRSGTRTDLKEWIAPTEIWHSMSDGELMWRASMVPGIVAYPYDRRAKLAFMFLSRGRLPLAPLWELFFKGHDDLFTIYLHTSPNSTDEPLPSSVFYKRRIPSKVVEWGKATMVDAERRLLANALLDFSNERFILLSEACIPLFNFPTIYSYLFNSNHSYVGSFDDPRSTGRGRYNMRMWPTISISDWRKGSQWFEVGRKLAVRIVSDIEFYPVLRDHCRRPCYMDEHYVATLVAKLGADLNSNRSVTWVDWSRPGPHPATFWRKDVNEEFLSRLRAQRNCSYNGIEGSICFLFARKFHASTLQPLMRIASSLLGFNESQAI